MNIRKKPAEWLKRYGPAELCAIAGAVGGGLLVHSLAGNPLLTALGGTWGENVGYYGFIILSDVRRRKDKSIGGLGKLARNMLVEFGPAESMDSFFVRPAAMYFFPKLLGNIALGLLVGKLAADILYYIPTILGYELRKKYFKD